MLKPIQLAIFSSTFLSASAFAAGPMVIYGEDGRQEVHEASELHQRLAKSSATMISKAKMSRAADKPGLVQIKQETLKEWINSSNKPSESSKLLSPKAALAAEEGMGFCEAERFIDQPNAGVCSGFLIAPDLLVTAGHCVSTYAACENNSWVFEYQVDKVSKKAGVDISEKNIYGCKRVVSTTLRTFLSLDYAVVQLDRNVTGREPLEIRSEKMIEDQTELVVIGSPSGLPLKVTVGGSVRKNTHPNFFTANLDTYQGNSGSAVFNAKTGVVEGILVRGENDFVANEENACIESNRCKEGECRGEDVSRLTSIPEIAFGAILNQAAESGDRVQLQKILKTKFWPDFYGKDKKSALMKASATGQAISIELLIASGADVELTDMNGNSSLHHLAQILNLSNANALDQLILAKVSLESKNNEGRTASLVAAKNLNAEGIKLLLKAGAEKTAVDPAGETVLFPFARNSDFKAVIELADAGVDPTIKTIQGSSILDLKNSAGNTLLLDAAKKSEWESVLKLARMGADLNAKDLKGDTALLVMASKLDLTAVKAMLAAGADKNGVNNQGENILFAFARQGDLRAVLELADLGVNLTAKNLSGVSVLTMKNMNGDTLLLQAAKSSAVEDVLKLAKLGADINAPDLFGETALYSVIRSQSVENLKSVITAGARIQVSNKKGVTPTDLVRELGPKDAKKVMRLALKKERRVKIANNTL